MDASMAPMIARENARTMISNVKGPALEAMYLVETSALELMEPLGQLTTRTTTALLMGWSPAKLPQRNVMDNVRGTLCHVATSASPS